VIKAESKLSVNPLSLKFFSLLPPTLAANSFFGPCFAGGVLVQATESKVRLAEYLASSGGQGPCFLIICSFFDGIEKGSEID